MNELLALASALSLRAGDTPEQVDARVQRALDALTQAEQQRDLEQRVKLAGETA